MLTASRFLLIVHIFISSYASAQNAHTTIPKPGNPVDRELIAGQKHVYEIALTEGQYISLTIEQQGIDVIVKLFSPKRKLITDYDSVDGLRGIEDPEFVAEAAGTYTLEVQPTRKEAPAGRYKIKFIEMRAATDRDRLLLQARMLHREAVKLYFQDQVDSAIAPAQRALEIYEKVLGDHARTAIILEFVGKILITKSENAKAQQYLERALEIGQRVFQDNDLRLALIIKDVGLANYWMGNYDKAEALFQHALRMYQNSPNDPQYHKIGHTLQCLSMIYANQWGDYAKVEELDKRILTVWEAAYGEESTWVIGTLSDLAEDYRLSGNYVQAESLLLRALTVVEKSVVKDEPFVNTTFQDIVGNLAQVYIDKGDYDRAAALLERHVANFEKLAVGQDYTISFFFDALVAVYQFKGEFDKAERLLLHAIDIAENMYGDEHILLSDPLLKLATLYYERRDYVRAETLLDRALTVNRKTLGSENSDVALILDMLGNVHLASGEYAKAESLYKDALRITEKFLGSNHPDMSKVLNHLATLSAAKGDGVAAVDFQLQANAVDEHNISLNLSTGSERQKLLYLRTLMNNVSKTISFEVQFAPDGARTVQQTIELILQRKGRVQDVITNDLAILRRHLNAEDQELLYHLNAITAQLSRLVLEGSQAIKPAELRRRIKVLEEQKEKLEGEISRRSAGFYQQSQPLSLADIRSALPDNAALIELVVYRPFDPKADAYGEPRYVAYVIRNQGEIHREELGDAKTIDGAVGALRQRLRDPHRKDVRKLARIVDEQIMHRLRPFFGDATHLLISPDGELNLIPFEALVDERGRFLIENYACTYLTSGRDLLRIQVARESRSKPLIIANPSFGEPSMVQIASVDAGHAVSNNRRRSITTTRSLSDVYFAPLDGTAKEAESIQTLFPQAKLLAEGQATESALKQVAAPSILHIATHGFFLTDTARAPADSTKDTRSIRANAKIENPLLRSGLALTGANRTETKDEDGILTALEASGLNLWGTKLVTLSACDTGIGEVKIGEGVYGLRRAFMLAGTETLVMSLWPVSDYLTRELMSNYYKSLKQGLGRGEALRQVQLNILHNKGREHPFYWAGFIQSGEWANLDGKR